jgi:uroporphyrinogen-III synthase
MPLLTIGPPEKKPLAPNNKAVLVFTSPNGVYAYQSFGFDVDHTVITVGDKTASVARAAGFTDVRSAKGASADVTQLVLAAVPTSTPVIHCAGQHVRGMITEDLRAAGYDARRDLYYRSDPVKTLPDINLGEVDYIALYSPKAAETLAGFPRDLSQQIILSISAATDAALGGIKAKARRIAGMPNEPAMLALLNPPSSR